MKKLVIGLCVSVVLSVILVIPAFTAYAQSLTTKTPLTQGPLQQINKYFSTQTITYSDGTILDRDIINGPPVPPAGYELERETVSLPEPNPEMGAYTLTVPAFRWVFGCSAVSGAMIAGYYDRNGFSNMYTGPTNGGVMPLIEDLSWGSWTDSASAGYPNNPLIASHNGLDGRSTRGSIDDYWIQYGSSVSDPYIAGSWTQHTWGDVIGDYMKTSQSAYTNTDGSTAFYSYTSSASQLTCADMEDYSIDTLDGTYGRKLFYEARGYTVTDCYSQKTDNTITGGFSFAQYKAEIDAGRPVMLNLAGHTIVGVGYDDAGSTVYIHDTWDNSNHTMTWGDSYSGMALLNVSIVNLQESTPEGTLGTEITITGAPSGFGDKKGKVLIGGLTQKIDTWTPASIKVTVKKVPLPAAPYDVSIISKTMGTIPLDVVFTVKNPELENPLSDSAGRPEDEITISGNFFGIKKGKVYLEYLSNGQTKKKNCKVTYWYMNPKNGVSELRFVVPKVSKSFIAGDYLLKVDNKIGIATASPLFTILP
jgi:YD repeat-containing protein